jgi:hypothetical protein
MIALMPAYSDQSEGWPSPSCHPLSDAVLTVVPTDLHDDVELVSRRFVVEPHPTTCPGRAVRDARRTLDLRVHSGGGDLD